LRGFLVEATLAAMPPRQPSLSALALETLGPLLRAAREAATPTDEELAERRERGLTDPVKGGLTLDESARRYGTTASAISAVEHGSRGITWKRALRLLAALGWLPRIELVAKPRRS